jgi:hypothetical protein
MWVVCRSRRRGFNAMDEMIRARISAMKKRALGFAGFQLFDILI